MALTTLAKAHKSTKCKSIRAKINAKKKEISSLTSQYKSAFKAELKKLGKAKKTTKKKTVKKKK